MKTIDLHGIKHNEVEKVILDAVCKYDVPFRTITGHSFMMKRIVKDTLDILDLYAREEIGNDGCLIVFEKRKKK
jgi:hypothetical protein